MLEFPDDGTPRRAPSPLGSTLHRWLLRALRLCALACTLPCAAADMQDAGKAAPLPVKVMIVNMFRLEAAPWLAQRSWTREIRVPGLPADYPTVHCDVDSVCQLTTGMGHANAAASMMAVLYSGQFDLHRTYFLIAGIAGIDPSRGTIGSVAWARYVVDMGLAQEIDARELPRGWRDGYFGVNTDGPDRKPKFEYDTEVFRLDETLLQSALALSGKVTLEDSDDVRAYRAHYPSAPANAPPQVIQCDTVSGDTWWSGARLSDHARRWTRLLTDEAGVYCTTQQEDNATLNALTRASESGLIDLKRIAVMRSGADFDRPSPRQNAFEALRAQRTLAGAIRTSTDNLAIAGMPLVQAIVRHWDEWQTGVPVMPAQ
jgi:purine nucleoside permease